MSKPKNPAKGAVISFRTAETIKTRVKKEAKRRKQSPAEFAESIFVPALEAATATAGK